MSKFSNLCNFKDIAEQMALLNPLGAVEYPLNVYEPCWCQSGKEWELCHRVRCSEKRMSAGEIQAHRVKDQEAWVRSSHTCLYPFASPAACSKKAIRSHTVQHNGGLSKIAENRSGPV
jgi:hypothetical protein